MAAPLAGRRVMVTRAAHQAGKLSDGLRALGAEPVEVPVLEIQPVVNPQALDASLRQLDQYDWLIFTSANTVHAVAARIAALGISLAGQRLPQIAAIGEATAAAARTVGFSIALVPESYVAESLLQSLAGRAQGTQAQGTTQKARILLARAEIARDVIPDALRTAGAAVDVVDAYRNVLPASAPALLRSALNTGIDAATFTSSSSVTHLAMAARAAEIAFPLAGVPAISIGPVTSDTLRKSGWEPAAEAVPFDIPGLIAAVQRVLL